MNKINILIYILILLFIGLLVYYFHEKGKLLEGMSPGACNYSESSYQSQPYYNYILQPQSISLPKINSNRTGTLPLTVTMNNKTDATTLQRYLANNYYAGQSLTFLIAYTDSVAPSNNYIYSSVTNNGFIVKGLSKLQTNMNPEFLYQGIPNDGTITQSNNKITIPLMKNYLGDDGKGIDELTLQKPLLGIVNNIQNSNDIISDTDLKKILYQCSAPAPASKPVIYQTVNLNVYENPWKQPFTSNIEIYQQPTNSPKSSLTKEGDTVVYTYNSNMDSTTDMFILKDSSNGNLTQYNVNIKSNVNKPAPAPATVTKLTPTQIEKIKMEIDKPINNSPFTIYYTDSGSKKYIQLDPNNDNTNNNTRIAYTTKTNATKFYFHKITSPNMTMILNEDKTYFLRNFGQLNLDKIETLGDTLGGMQISKIPEQIDFSTAMNTKKFTAQPNKSNTLNIFTIDDSMSPSPIQNTTSGSGFTSSTSGSPSPTTSSSGFTSSPTTSSSGSGSTTSPATSGSGFTSSPATSDSHQKQCSYIYGGPLLTIHHSNVNKVLQ